MPKCPLKLPNPQLNIFDRTLSDRALAQQVVNRLSERELTCFMLSSRGLSTKQIAAKLFISYKTASTHRFRMRQKLSLQTTEALAVLGWRVCEYLDKGLVLKQTAKSSQRPIDNVDIPWDNSRTF
jgi:DNA-binding CsgD family transcriptional regulator